LNILKELADVIHKKRKKNCLNLGIILTVFLPLEDIYKENTILLLAEESVCILL
jgi:hypothetical protein